jgi:hypothetical protein
VFNGVNALAFGTLFSSQGASADPKEGTPRRWGRATHHGRHAGRGANRTVALTCALRFAVRIQKAGRSNGRSSRDGKSGLAGAARRPFEYAWRPPFPRDPEFLCLISVPLPDIAQIGLGVRPTLQRRFPCHRIQEALEDLRIDAAILAMAAAIALPSPAGAQLAPWTVTRSRRPRPDLRRGVVCERGTRLEYREPAEATARTDPV